MDTLLALPPLLPVPREALRDVERGAALEWIESDGAGGWAAGTAIGANTRRRHGLLVVARRPPADRVVLLSRIEEAVVLEDGTRFELSVNFYPDTVHPTGHEMLEGFALDPWPVWRYRMGDVELTKELFRARAARATVLRYRLEGATGAVLEARPLFAGRPFDELAPERAEMRPGAEASERIVAYQPYDELPSVILSFADGRWSDEGVWYYRTSYPRDREEGQDGTEDLYSPGLLRMTLEPERAAVLACGIAPARVARASVWASGELQRREVVALAGRRVAEDEAVSEIAARLALAADAFVIDRRYGARILATQPGGMQGSRDALIALHGIGIVLGRVDLALAVLRLLADHLRNGLIPVRLPDDGGRIPDDHYASVDTSLWFVEGVAAVHEAGGDAGDLWPAVREILAAYQAGTSFGIRLDQDGLVRHGAGNHGLTWMDGTASSAPAAPRNGKAVEVNALWFNALERAAALPWAEEPARLRELAARCATAFGAFWYERGGYLYDTIDPLGRPDVTLRPNQVFAAALPFSPLDRVRARSMLRVIERELLLPCGLRTLPPSHPAYRGHLEKNAGDEARASGAAWPWLLGPFARAWLHVHDEDRAARTRVRELFFRLASHLTDHGLGSLSECCAGAPPHAPGGAPAHAAAVGEALRMAAMLR